MIRRSLLWAAGLLLVASACTADEASDEGSATTSIAGTTTTAVSSQPTRVADLPGRLVVLDFDGNIFTIDPDGSDPAQVTDDGGESARYAQPSFSPVSDTIAWAEITTAGTGLGSSDGRGRERVSIPMTAPPFYMFWSPDGSGIGVLHNGLQGTIEFEMVDVESASAEVVASGAPFYFSWSPDSSQVAVHAQLDVFAAIDLDGNTTDLGSTDAGYQAPHWTPTGIFHLADDGLELRDPAGEAEILVSVPGPVAFVSNRQGTRVAVQSFVSEDPPGISAALSETPHLPSNAVVVLEVATGEMLEVTPNPSIGFFWSPDGEALLVLEPRGASSGEMGVLVWKDGEARELSVIAPQPSFVGEVLRFFDQYGQSLQLWSPDSSAFALAGAINGEPGVWVQNIDGDAPVKVFEGDWAVWSNG
jgi:hypothetical protein